MKRGYWALVALMITVSRMGTSVWMGGASLTDEGDSPELAALVGHALIDHVACPQQQ